MMNKFNDIIQDEVFLELPGQIDSFYDYKDIIRKAFDLTKGVLNLDDISISEDGKYYKFKIISKGTETNFKLNVFNKSTIDIKNLLRGLNKALTDIFYLGSERFYSVGGTIVPYGIGFISNKQKRTLQKEGLIGNIISYSGNKKDDIPKKVVKENNILEPIETNIAKIQSENISHKREIAIKKKRQRLYKKLDNKSILRIFEIIHYPEENSIDTVAVAKIIAVDKQVPIFDKEEFRKLKMEHRIVIEKLSNKKNKALIRSLLGKLDLDRKTKIMILSEVQRNLKNEDDDPSLLKIIAGFFGFSLIISIVNFFSKKD